jgi:hypothetical protein
MEKKCIVSERPYVQELLPLGCRSVFSRKKQNVLKSFLRRYQKGMDLVLAATAITLMFLTGIWAFFIELAEFAVHP